MNSADSTHRLRCGRALAAGLAAALLAAGAGGCAAGASPASAATDAGRPPPIAAAGVATQPRAPAAGAGVGAGRSAMPARAGAASHSPHESAHKRPEGYLEPGALDIVKILPPAPVKGEPRYQADRRIFRETRALKGSARWAMAITDANFRPAAVLQHFACSMNMQVTPAQVPRLLHIMGRASRDVGRAIVSAKHHFRRLRPFWIDAGPTCRPRSLLGKTFDYPSGHATAGWMWAMILAQVEPDRATQILARGRAIGQSRVVCGVHNASAVRAGRMTATAVMAEVMATPAYQRDLAAARVELRALRRTAPRPNPEQCASEAKLVAEGYGSPRAQ